MLQYSQMSNDVQFQSVAEVDNFAESTNSSLNYLILEALGIVQFCPLLDINTSIQHILNVQNVFLQFLDILYCICETKTVSGRFCTAL